MTDREVMQQALYTLERVAAHLMRPQDVEVMQALRAQLEQPEQVSHAHEWFRTGAMEPGKMRCIHCGAWGNDASLTTSPQQQAEPVAYFEYQKLKFTWAKHMKIDPVPVSIKVEPLKLYTAPPQRKPLTEEEILLTYQKQWHFHPSEEPNLAKGVVQFARVIEQAHGIGEKP